MRQIKLTIDAKGKTKIEVSGVSGSDCLSLTVGLEARLGGGETDRELTAEMFEVYQVAVRR